MFFGLMSHTNNRRSHAEDDQARCAHTTVTYRYALAAPLLAACLFGATSLDGAAAVTKTPTARNTPSTSWAVLSSGPVVEDVQSYRLSNGLQLLLLPDDSKSVTSVYLTYFVGARDELYGDSGSAHLLEHMMFLGTPKVPQPRDEFRKRGMQYNATTLDDSTSFFASFAANAQSLDWLLMMEADRMANASVSPESLSKEMNVVRNELERGENAATNLLFQRMQALAYRYHKYREPVIGNRSDIEQVDLDHLRSLYRRFYRPDNAVLVVAGNFDKAKVKRAVAQYFGALPENATPIERRNSLEPAQDGERSVTLRRPGELPFVASQYHIPSCLHPDHPALQVLSYLLSNGGDGRLQKQLVENKLALNGSAYASCNVDPSLFTVGLTLPKDAKLPEIEDKLNTLLEKDLVASVSDAEIERAKAAYVSRFHNSLSNVTVLASLLGGAARLGDWRNLYVRRDRLQAVSSNDVRRVARQYFQPANRTSGRFIPSDAADKVEISQAADITALTENYVGKGAASAGEKFEPSVANMEKRVRVGQFANGLKYALLPRKSHANKVLGTLNVRWGDAKTTFGQEFVGDLMATQLGKATTRRDKIALSSEADRLQSGWRITTTAQDVAVGFSSEKDKIESVLDLIAEVLREPVFVAKEFEVAKNRAVESVAARIRSTDPAVLADRAINRHFAIPAPRGDLRYTYTDEEALEEWRKLNFADIENYYRANYGVSQGEIVIVGDFDPDVLQAALSKRFGTWQASPQYQHLDQPFLNPAPLYKRIQTADRANAVYTARLNLPIGEQHPDRLALSMANALLGGSDKARLSNRIRTQEGLSYGIYSNISLGWLDNWGTWTINGSFAPENRAKVEAMVREEIDLARSKGFSQSELDNEKEGLLRNLRAALANENTQIGMLQNLLRFGLPLKRAENDIAAVEALTLQQVNAALRLYLDPARLSVVVAGDFAKAEAAK